MGNCDGEGKKNAFFQVLAQKGQNVYQDAVLEVSQERIFKVMLPLDGLPKINGREIRPRREGGHGGSQLMIEK